jgi:Flp pilus assembly protein TadD
MNRYVDAIEALKNAIRLEPNYPEAHNEYGYALHQLHRYAEAIQQYEAAISQKTNYASAHYNLGMSYIALNNRNGAMEQYRILQGIDAARATKLFNQIK